jgi:hypothetical protein
VRQREIWEPESTLNNIRLIRKYRAEGDPDNIWIQKIEEELETAAKGD